MKLFGFGNPKPAPPSLEEKLAAELETLAPENAPETEDPAEIEAAVRPETHAETEPEPLADMTQAFPGASQTLDDADDLAAISPAPDLELSAPTPEPPRALFPGSYLNGEYEIKEIISRGAINFYLADAGDYGAHDFKLIAERAATSSEIVEGPQAEFFPLAARFAQDNCEYAAFDFQTLQALEDWSAAPNDETYFGVMGQVARGFLALENANLKADLPLESLFFDGMGELKCFGFFDAAESLESAREGVSPSTDALTGALQTPALHQLSALSSRFAKTNLAARATLRLDDEFGALPFSEEVKNFARALNNGEFANVAEVAAALEGFAPLQITASALLSDVGMERELNEDCGLIWKSSRAGHARNFNLELLAVADGMGGHEGGEVASDVTLSALESAISRRQNLNLADNALVSQALSEVLSEVNDAVIRLTENPPYAAMRAKPGATLVCALRVGSRVFVGNVGDSRAYRWNAQNGLQRLTKDHSYVQDLLDSGSISDAEAWGHPDGSVITSHIGLLRGFKKDVFLRVLRPGDRLVLVSDGVVDTLRDAEIEAIIALCETPEKLCAALVNGANDAGGFDNITVAALFCS